MKIRLTPAVLAEMRDTMADAVAGKTNDPSDATYAKIHQALHAASGADRGLALDLNDADIAELKSRAEFNAGPNGPSPENIGWSSDPADKGYWLGRLRAYKSLLAQIEAAEQEQGVLQ